MGDPRKHESLRYGKAELSDLGAKLLGLESWHAEQRTEPETEPNTAQHTAQHTVRHSTPDGDA